MICPNCKVPMHTKKGSENGIMTDTIYLTSEVKLCPQCGLEVAGYYEAEQIKQPKIKTIKNI